MLILTVYCVLQLRHVHHAIQDTKEQHAKHAVQDTICQIIAQSHASPALQQCFTALLVLIALIAQPAIQLLIRYPYAHVLQVIMYQTLTPIHALNAQQRLLTAVFVRQLLHVILAKMDILEHYVTLVIL